MLQKTLIWPAHFDIQLCPFALDHAAYIWSHLPDARKFDLEDVVAPIELYASSKLDLSRLRNEKVWGCPVYVLYPTTLQDGKKIPKWDN